MEQPEGLFDAELFMGTDKHFAHIGVLPLGIDRGRVAGKIAAVMAQIERDDVEIHAKRLPHAPEAVDGKTGAVADQNAHACGITLSTQKHRCAVRQGLQGLRHGWCASGFRGRSRQGVCSAKRFLRVLHAR